MGFLVKNLHIPQRQLIIDFIKIELLRISCNGGQFSPDEGKTLAGLGGQEGCLELIHIGNGGRSNAGVPEQFPASGIEVISFGQQDEGEPGKMFQGQGRIL